MLRYERCSWLCSFLPWLSGERTNSLANFFFALYWWGVSSSSWIRNLYLQTCSKRTILTALNHSLPLLDPSKSNHTFPVNIDMIQSKICFSRIQIPCSGIMNSDWQLLQKPEVSTIIFYVLGMGQKFITNHGRPYSKVFQCSGKIEVNFQWWKGHKSVSM